MKTYEELIQKYNVPVPRYTSYPTVPMWEADNMQTPIWFRKVKETFEKTNKAEGISIYIHLPYCESLCTYCACNKHITKSHGVEAPYIEAVLAEWNMYLQQFTEKPVVSEMHLGGGTPTFFSPENLEKLIGTILNTVNLHPDYEFSFEGHPNNTTYEHLKTLYNLGFQRVSYGVQDLDLKVQRTINRIQPYENVEQVTLWARNIGYRSVNFDLVYGLPFQTTESVQYTIEQISKLSPDRIAFYSYAHVPWKKKEQRSYTEADLPSDAQKRELYELGKKMLLSIGLKDIGMDHFAKPVDKLFEYAEAGKLHRNFMGYTTSQSKLLIGLGNSSISDAFGAFAQNEKTISAYKMKIEQGILPITKGHVHTTEDIVLRKAILKLSCNATLKLTDEIKALLPQSAFDTLQEMQAEQIVEINDNVLSITNFGLPFLRNICSVFDLKMARKTQSNGQMFSKSI